MNPEDLLLDDDVQKAIQAQIKAGPHSAVGFIARRSEDYPHADEALRRLGIWVERAAEGDRVQCFWADGMSAGNQAEITSLVKLPTAPTPPAPRQCIPTNRRCLRARNTEFGEYEEARALHRQKVVDLRAVLRRQSRDSLQRADGGPAAVATAFQRGAALLQGMPGTRWLVLAAPLGADPSAVGRLPLDGVQIRMLFPHAHRPAELRSQAARWRTWASAQRASLRVLDGAAELDRELPFWEILVREA